MPYGVRRGRQTGVYDTWEECRDQVNRYPSASFKKFPSYHQAEDFVHSSDQPSSSSHRRSSGYREGDYPAPNVYTDGSCSRNGQYGAHGGIGVYWGPENPMNVSERLEGRQTNQRAELKAAAKALEQARSENMTKLNIHTDSKFTVDGMRNWVPTWKENGWKTYNGGDVVNKEDFQKLDNLSQDIQVTWNYVPGHAGNTGNEMADKLARHGARK
ncbi:ribonuclease H1-like isoform 2-T2 [Pelodytes ibericus]